MTSPLPALSVCRIIPQLLVLLLSFAIHISASAQDPQLTVEIDGVEGALRDNVEAYLQIRQLIEDDRPLPGEARLRWLHNRAEEDIREALAPFGYYRPEIESRLTETDDGWLAAYTIDPGPQLPIAELDLQLTGAGQDDAALQQILADTSLAEGDTLDQRRYEQLKSALQSAATERGYFDARLTTNRILIDLDDYQARVILHYDTGERYRFGAVEFVEPNLTPALLQRYVPFQPGDPYYAPDLLALQSELLASEYFDQVIIDASPNAAVEREIPVKVEMTMRKRSKYTFGLGYATDTGARGRAGLERRWINRFGHSLEAQTFVSQIRSSLGAAYVMPGDDPRTDSDRFRIKFDSEDSDTREFVNATFGYSRQFQDGPWTKIYNIDYLWEKFDSGSERKTTTLLMPGLRWNRVEAADRLRVERGWSLTLEARAAAEPLLSSLSFAQFGANFKGIYSISRDHRLIGRTRLGTTLIADDDFPDFPTSLRYYAGGDNSVRGYSLDSIGPVDDDGVVIGGKYLLVGGLEYDYRLRDDWSVAAFVDAGDAFNDTPELKFGAGFGVRWQSPVGPVRLDLAHGFEEPGDAFRIHFSIGPEL